MSDRPPAPSGSGLRLSDKLTIAKIKYYEAKTAYYEKLSSVAVTIPQWPNWGKVENTKESNDGQADQKASS